MSFLGVTTNSLSSRSCNGDVQEPSSDDEMFVNSRLGLEGFDRPRSLFLELEESEYSERIKYSMSPLFSPLTPQNEQNAIIFSINFCGKYFGELGLFEPDISILDWHGFKTYLCSSLNLENSESYVISYEDNEGDKIPIQSKIEYNEAMRLAKVQSLNHKKFHLNINRLSSGFPRVLRSLVTSSLRRVNSVGGSRHYPEPPKKRSITTSTSFIDLGSKSFEIVDVKSDTYSPNLPDSMTSWGRKSILPIQLILDFDTEKNTLTRLYNCTNDTFTVMNYTVKPFDKMIYNKNCFSNPFPVVDNGEDKKEVSYQLDLSCLLSHDDDCEAPDWFQDSMQKMKRSMMNDISSKLSENFQEFVGNLHDFDVEEKLRRIIGYDHQDKMEFCCRGHGCSKQASMEVEREEELARMKECQERHLKEIQSLQGLKSKIEDNQAQLFAFIQNSNEEIKRKLSSRDFTLDKFVPSQEQLLFIEERKRVLSRIEGCSQRSSTMSAAINSSDNAKKVLNSSFTSSTGVNAKFCADVTYPDGSSVLCGQKFTKTWKIGNNGNRTWPSDVKLVCHDNSEITTGLIPTRFEVMCPPLAPGEQGFVSIDFVSPNTQGMYMIKCCFMVDGYQFGDILWCSVEVLKEIVTELKTPIGPTGVLKTILNLLSQERPNFEGVPECQQELDLVVNYLQECNQNNYLAIKSFLQNSPPSSNIYLEDSGALTASTVEEVDDSGPSIEPQCTTVEAEAGNKDDRGNPDAERENLHQFRLTTSNLSPDLVRPNEEMSGIPIEEYKDNDESDYCDSHSEVINSEEDEDYQSDPLEYENFNVKSVAVVEEPRILLDEDYEELKRREIHRESETENDYEETEEEGTDFDDERAEEDDDLITESESELIEGEEMRRLESTSRSWTDKKFTLHEDNFKQNMQVKLDFEVISKPPILQTSASSSAIQSLSQSHTGPLTFREQHFTTSGCSMPPPPKPVQVPESDDDFDGVFIAEDDNRKKRMDEVSSKDNDSASTSSFSECDDEDLPNAPPENSSSRGLMPNLFGFFE